MRLVTCRVPIRLLNWLTAPFSLVWWLYMKLPFHTHPYHRLFRTAPFWHVHSILFDQLLPEIANYWTKDEAIALFDGLPVEQVEAHWINRGSWTVVARRRTA